MLVESLIKETMELQGFRVVTVQRTDKGLEPYTSEPTDMELTDQVHKTWRTKTRPNLTASNGI